MSTNNNNNNNFNTNIKETSEILTLFNCHIIQWNIVITHTGYYDMSDITNKILIHLLTFMQDIRLYEN